MQLSCTLSQRFQVRILERWHGVTTSIFKWAPQVVSSTGGRSSSLNHIPHMESSQTTTGSLAPASHCGVLSPVSSGPASANVAKAEELHPWVTCWHSHPPSKTWVISNHSWGWITLKKSAGNTGNVSSILLPPRVSDSIRERPNWKHPVLLGRERVPVLLVASMQVFILAFIWLLWTQTFC